MRKTVVRSRPHTPCVGSGQTPGDRAGWRRRREYYTGLHAFHDGALLASTPVALMGTGSLEPGTAFDSVCLNVQDQDDNSPAHYFQWL